MGMPGPQILFRRRIVRFARPPTIGLVSELAPGPDYKLYLPPQFVETEAEFMRLKPRMVRMGDVDTFKNFLVAVPESVDIGRYNTVVSTAPSGLITKHPCARNYHFVWRSVSTRQFSLKPLASGSPCRCRRCERLLPLMTSC